VELPGQAESGAADDAREENTAGHISALDARLVKESFGVIEGRAQEAMEHFYAWLFVRHPEIRAMFPLAMSAQRERVFGVPGRAGRALAEGVAQLLRRQCAARQRPA
jgi:hypothetical protein